MTEKVLVMVDRMFHVELDEEGQRLWSACENADNSPGGDAWDRQAELHEYLAGRIKLKGSDIFGAWDK